jgi:hypothetical protein
MLKKASNFVLGSKKSSTYPRGYALYLGSGSYYMNPQTTQDVIGRYASGRVRPYRSQVITSCLQRARTVAWATEPASLQGRALPEAQDEGGEHGRDVRVCRH